MRGDRLEQTDECSPEQSIIEAFALASFAKVNYRDLQLSFRIAFAAAGTRCVELVAFFFQRLVMFSMVHGRPSFQFLFSYFSCSSCS